MLQLVNCALLHSIKCPNLEDKWPHHHKSIPTSLLLSDFLLFLYPGTGLWDFLHLASHYVSFNTLLGSLPLVSLFKLWKIQALSHLHPHSIFFLCKSIEAVRSLPPCWKGLQVRLCQKKIIFVLSTSYTMYDTQNTLKCLTNEWIFIHEYLMVYAFHNI